MRLEFCDLSVGTNSTFILFIHILWFLLSLRAIYFSTTQDMTSTRTSTGFPRSTLYTRTEGTAGMFHAFRSDFEDDGDDADPASVISLEMKV